MAGSPRVRAASLIPRSVARVDGVRDPPARGFVDQGRECRVRAQQLVNRHRVGIEVEKAAAPADRHLQVSRVTEPQSCADVIGQRSQRNNPVTVRQAQRPAVGPVAPLLDPGHPGSGEVAEKVVRAKRRPERQAQRQDPGATGGCPRAARPRSSVGESTNTSWTVSLNARMLANPAARAICVIGSVLVSINTRAVWARSARARASGPAPSSARSCRSTCRTL